MTQPYSPGSESLLKRIQDTLSESRSLRNTLPLAVKVLVESSHNEDEKEQIFQRIAELAVRGEQKSRETKRVNAATIGHLQESAEALSGVEHEAAHLLQFANDIDAYIQSNMVYNWRWLAEALDKIELKQFEQAAGGVTPERRQKLIEILKEETS